MGHCRIHGSYSSIGWFSDHDDGCPECSNTEELNQAVLLGVLKRLHDVPAQAPPSKLSKDYGDYTCPDCRYKTLRRGASRCPECQGELGSAFWTEVYREEERKRQQEKEATAVQRAKDEKSNQEYQRNKPVRLYFWYVLPILTLLSHIVITDDIREGTISQWVSLFVPFYNWLLVVYIALLKAKGAPQLIWIVILAWTVVGLILRPILRRPEKSV